VLAFGRGNPGSSPAGMIQIKARPTLPDHLFSMWKPISSAPFHADLELAVIDGNGEHPLVFPCRRAVGGWINNNKQVEVHLRIGGNGISPLTLLWQVLSLRLALQPTPDLSRCDPASA
jgi:hypothetical protein